jgi:hypothetical protein
VDVYRGSRGEPLIGHPPPGRRARLLREKLAVILANLHILPALRPQEIVNLLPSHLTLWLDVKGRGAPELLEKLGPLMGWASLVISTRYHNEAPGIKKIAPHAMVMLSLESRPPSLKALKVDGIDGVSIEVSYVDEDLLVEARRLSLRVAVWVLNTPDEIREAILKRVDFIVTDFPEVAREICSGLAGLK